MAQITMKEMLDAGVHFGHQTQRWNPKMKPYVYTDRGGIHIIDLQKSVAKARQAAEFATQVGAKGGKMIFVGTKKQAVDPVKEAAQNSDQYFVTKRWLGGTLTNIQTIKLRIDRLRRIDQMREKGELNYYSKKERGKIEKEYDKLNSFLEGLREMKAIPKLMFVVDINKERIAVLEAKRLGIPVIAIADTNTDPECVDFAIPGNDDAIRSISLFTNLIANSFQEGLKIFKESSRAEVNEEGAVDNKKQKPVEKEQRTAGGPDVVKVSRGRKLVAAGTAEDVEIEMELDRKDDTPEASPTEPAATPDATAKKTTDKATEKKTEEKS